MSTEAIAAPDSRAGPFARRPGFLDLVAAAPFEDWIWPSGECRCEARCLKSLQNYGEDHCAIREDPTSPHTALGSIPHLARQGCLADHRALGAQAIARPFGANSTAWGSSHRHLSRAARSAATRCNTWPSSAT